MEGSKIMKDSYEIYRRLVDVCDQWSAYQKDVRVKAAYLTEEGGHVVISDLNQPKNKRYSVHYVDSRACVHRYGMGYNLNEKQAIARFERKTGIRVCSLTLDGQTVRLN
jgi:IS1 family transposase